MSPLTELAPFRASWPQAGAPAGPAPLIAVALLGSFEQPNPGRVALYVAVCAAVTLVAVLSYGETRVRDLGADDAVEPADGRAATRV